MLVLACSDSVVAPPRPILAIASGDGQHGRVGTALPIEIMVELRDSRQRALAGVTVTWRAAPGLTDVISPDALKTDANGRARASWLLDETPGNHVLLVSTPGGAQVRVDAWADARPLDDVHSLPMITYDGSGQIVHPDFVRLPASWIGDPMRLVATPYPGGAANFENPSLYTGSTGVAWEVPAGMRNPLVSPTTGYLSDPDIVYDPDAGELRIYYRRVTTENEIWLIRSADGTTWSAPELTLHAPNHLIVSPTIVRRAAGDWLMWSVNAGTSGCRGQSTVVELRRSTDGVSWSAPEQATLRDPDGFAWHIDVEWIPSRNEFWAVYPVKRPGSCTTDRLRLATSADGVRWQTYPSVVLLRGASAELNDVIYRSSVDYDATADVVSLWYSGARVNEGVYAWHLAWERMPASALFTRVNQPATAAMRTPAPAVPSVPQLTNETAP